MITGRSPLPYKSIFFTTFERWLKIIQLKRFTGYIVLVFTLLFTCPAFTQFQPTPVVKSNEKTIVNGKIFYIHTVQKGQTLYSISKAYEVTQEQIKNANPQIDVVNLVEGLAIRIPASPVNKEAPAYPSNREDFYAHEVKRKETVYSISRKYHVDTDVIYYYNPWAKDGIKQDQTLWIPKKDDMRDISQEARKDDAYYYYTVKQKDTLYSIARAYGVEISDIINANPALRDGLKPDMTIVIPKIPLPGASDTLVTELSTEPSCIAPSDPGHTFNVVVMLPFFASGIEEINLPSDSISDEVATTAQLRDRSLRGKPFAEMYEGFLLAVDSIKKTGLSVNLHVFDTERDTNKIRRILRDVAQMQPDIIIGPVFAEDVRIAARYAQFSNTALVSPLSTRSTLLNGNSNLIQVFPSRENESYALANHLRQYKTGRIITISGTDPISVRNSKLFRESLLASRPVKENGEPLHFSAHRLNDSLFTRLPEILSKEEENLLIVFSDKEAEVNSLVTRLIQRTSLYPVRLFGMPSWQGWTNIDLTFLHNLNLTLISPFYTDFSDKRIKNYLKKSRNMYGYEPYEVLSSGYNFSMYGFDLGIYFLSALKQYGRNFVPCIDQLNSTQLLTRYNFVRTPSGGYVNNNFCIIRYLPDFTIERTGMVDAALPQN